MSLSTSTTGSHIFLDIMFLNIINPFGGYNSMLVLPLLSKFIFLFVWNQNISSGRSKFFFGAFSLLLLISMSQSPFLLQFTPKYLKVFNFSKVYSLTWKHLVSLSFLVLFHSRSFSSPGSLRILNKSSIYYFSYFLRLCPERIYIFVVSVNSYKAPHELVRFLEEIYI